MSMTTPLVLLTALTVASVPDGAFGDGEYYFESAAHFPPAPCISAIGPRPTIDRGARWHDLLPTISLGFEFRPRQRQYARFETVDTAGQNADAHSSDFTHRDRTRRRWTITLRWRSNSRSQPPNSNLITPSPATRLCRQYLDVIAERPTGLAEAVDQWSEKSRLRALIDATSAREVNDE